MPAYIPKARVFRLNNFRTHTPVANWHTFYAKLARAFECEVQIIKSCVLKELDERKMLDSRGCILPERKRELADALISGISRIRATDLQKFCWIDRDGIVHELREKRIMPHSQLKLDHKRLRSIGVKKQRVRTNPPCEVYCISVSNLAALGARFRLDPNGVTYRIAEVPSADEITAFFDKQNYLEIAMFPVWAEGKKILFMQKGEEESFSITDIEESFPGVKIGFLLHTHPESANWLPSGFGMYRGDFYMTESAWGQNCVERVYIYQHGNGYIEFGSQPRSELSEYKRVAVMDVWEEASSAAPEILNRREYDGPLFSFAFPHVHKDGNNYIYEEFLRFRATAHRVRLTDSTGRWVMWQRDLSFSLMMQRFIERS